MKTFILGTSIKVTDILNVDSVDTSTITIEDETDSEKITDADMIKEADRVYYYIYQSAKEDDPGIYTARITCTLGAYTAVKEKKFRMQDQSDED